MLLRVCGVHTVDKAAMLKNVDGSNALQKHVVVSLFLVGFPCFLVVFSAFVYVFSLFLFCFQF